MVNATLCLGTGSRLSTEITVATFLLLSFSKLWSMVTGLVSWTIDDSGGSELTLAAIAFDLDTVKLLMSIFDTDRSGTVTFSEFQGLWKYIKDWQGVSTLSSYFWYKGLTMH